MLFCIIESSDNEEAKNDLIKLKQVVQEKYMFFLISHCPCCIEFHINIFFRIKYFCPHNFLFFAFSPFNFFNLYKLYLFYFFVFNAL